MKITYKILWLDDKIEEFIEDELIQELEDFLKSEGFEPNIVTVDNSTEFFQKLDGSYDLVMTDYHMDQMNGDKVVEKMRTSELLTEVLFYTARAELAASSKLSRVTFLETRSKTDPHQQVVFEEAKKLIQMTIRLFQHIVAMRGMIMHETCSLDSVMHTTLKEFIKNANNSEQVEAIAEEVLGEAEAHFESKLADIKKWRENRNLNQASKDNFVFSSSYKITTMSRILQSLDREDFSEDYNREIIAIRNKFAHAILEQDGSGRQYFRSGGLTFNEDLCKQIRMNISKHDQNLKKLNKAVVSDPVT